MGNVGNIGKIENIQAVLLDDGLDDSTNNIKRHSILAGLKEFDWQMFIALCVLSLVPAIYQTIITKIVTTTQDPGNLDIIGQMEWFDLIDETLRAFLIVPMYSLLGRVSASKSATASKSDDFGKAVFRLGTVAIALYAVFSVVVLLYGIHLVTFIGADNIDTAAAYQYLSLETIAFMIDIIYAFSSIAFLIIGKAKYVYILLITKICLSIMLSGSILVPVMGINGIAAANILSNTILAITCIALLIREKAISPCNIFHNSDGIFGTWLRTGLFAGGQQFLDNIIYAVMIVKMVNAVSESGNYWVSNNFIWGWLLIPIMALSEIIKRDAGTKKYNNLIQRNYYIIVAADLIIWAILIPAYQWFFKDVEGIDNYQRIFQIVVMNLGFYIFFALSQIPDSIIVGMGKLEYNAINSIICNIVYYGIWFLLYISGTVNMNMEAIIIMFGFGNVVHCIISMIEERIFLKNKIRLF